MIQILHENSKIFTYYSRKNVQICSNHIRYTKKREIDLKGFLSYTCMATYLKESDNIICYLNARCSLVFQFICYNNINMLICMTQFSPRLSSLCSYTKVKNLINSNDITNG